MAFKYPVMLIPDEEMGGFTLQFGDIPAAITQGETWSEALNDGALLISETLELNYFEQDRAVPLPSNIEDMTLEDIGSFFLGST
jgi:antitoxin HicB